MRTLAGEFPESYRKGSSGIVKRSEPVLPVWVFVCLENHRCIKPKTAGEHRMVNRFMFASGKSHPGDANGSDRGA